MITYRYWLTIHKLRDSPDLVMRRPTAAQDKVTMEELRQRAKVPSWRQGAADGTGPSGLSKVNCETFMAGESFDISKQKGFKPI